MASRAAVHARRVRRALAGAGRGAALLGSVVCVLLTLGTTATAGATTGTTGGGVRLVAQTPVVVPPAGVLGIALTRTAALAHPNSTVQLTLFARLLTRDGLEAAIGAVGPTGQVATTRTIAARCLPGGAVARITAVVAVNGTRVTPPAQCGTSAPVLRLGCASGCDGVYPLEVTVRGGGTVQSLVTLVTFAATSHQKLRVVWVLRIAGRDHGLLAASGALGAIATHPKVPVTVDAQGVAVAHGLTEPGGIAAAALLRAALGGSVHELLGEPYVPADLGALRASRLPSEVFGQFALTDSVLLSAHVPSAPSRLVTVLSGPATPTAVDAVTSAHFHHLVLVGSDFATDPSSTLSWGAPFHVVGAPGGATALCADTELSALSENTQGDPALGAAQFLGELAFLHFEAPNLPSPRAVVVLTDATNDVTAPFVDAVLSGLSSNPVLAPATASDAFTRIPPGADGLQSRWPLALGPSHPLPSSTVREIRALRIMTDALSQAVSGGATPIPTIDGMLLGAERTTPAGVRSHELYEVRRALDQQRAYFHFYTGPITLTATGSTTIPITVLSDAPYSVHGLLELSSPRISFPERTLPFDLSGSVYSVRVPARALVNGDLPLTVRLLTPEGNLVLVRAMITVRVTGFSVVGLVLTVLAVGVLAVWWVRTARHKRAAR